MENEDGKIQSTNGNFNLPGNMGSMYRDNWGTRDNFRLDPSGSIFIYFSDV